MLQCAIVQCACPTHASCGLPTCVICIVWCHLTASGGDISFCHHPGDSLFCINAYAVVKFQTVSGYNSTLSFFVYVRNNAQLVKNDLVVQKILICRDLAQPDKSQREGWSNMNWEYLYIGSTTEVFWFVLNLVRWLMYKVMLISWM